MGGESIVKPARRNQEASRSTCRSAVFAWRSSTAGMATPLPAAPAAASLSQRRLIPPARSWGVDPCAQYLHPACLFGDRRQRKLSIVGCRTVLGEDVGHVGTRIRRPP